MFKEGDLIYCIKGSETLKLYKDHVYTIYKIDGNWLRLVEGPHKAALSFRFRKCLEHNPINELLYPDYEIFTHNEKKYLKPKKVWYTNIRN